MPLSAVCSHTQNDSRMSKGELEDTKLEENADDDAAEDGEDGDKIIDVEAVSSLRDTKYNLQVTLQEPARGLVVKPLTLIFDDSTIYGQRMASHDAWLVTSVSCGMSMKNKPIMKRLLVDKIPMLPRAASCHVLFAH